MFDSIEKKYKNSARELVWQWFFPSTYLTHIPETGQRKRYHLHESHVQKAIREAANKSQIPNPSALARIPFAIHLPATSCRLITTSAPFRNYWGTVTYGPP